MSDPLELWGLVTRYSSGHHRSQVERLLKEGVYLEVRNPWSDYGHTFLHYAVINGHLDLVELFLAYNAIVNVKDAEGNTPLHSVALSDLRRCEANRSALAQLLISKGAAPDARNNRGETPSDVAKRKGRGRLAKQFRKSTDPVSWTPSGESVDEPVGSGGVGWIMLVLLVVVWGGLGFLNLWAKLGLSVAACVIAVGIADQIREKKRGARTNREETSPPDTADTADTPEQANERKLWMTSCQEDTAGAYRRYLAESELRIFAEDAEDRLRLLEQRETDGQQTARSSVAAEPPRVESGEAVLERSCFLITADNALPPVGCESDRVTEFLERLRTAREDAVRFRHELCRDAERQAAEQGFPGMAGELLRDPIDDPLPGWYSLGILFGYEQMDDNYGAQAFHALLSLLDPSELTKALVIHFGDLPEFDTFCALMLRSTSVNDLAYVMSQFGPDVDAPGLLPHPIRFLRAVNTDGHLIARTFSLPETAELRGNTVHPKEGAGMTWIVEEAVKQTAWKKG